MEGVAGERGWKEAWEQSGGVGRVVGCHPQKQIVATALVGATMCPVVDWSGGFWGLRSGQSGARAAGAAARTGRLRGNGAR